MVPDLALGIFATATSTGDLWGDGDAVGFPVASKIIPAVEELLIAQVRCETVFLLRRTIICQDRLGTKMKSQQKGGVFCRLPL